MTSTNTEERPSESPATVDSGEELAALTTGVDYWTTAQAGGVRRLRMADGPHGLRIQAPAASDHLGLSDSAAATCFPPAVTLASSWDLDLVQEVGQALGREARAQGIDVVLGPGLNVKRTPLCGRNFEYFSEDPWLSGTLAAAMVRGIQSNGVSACIKHFAANNQEADRLRISAEIDERTLRETYLRAFQIALRESDPWSIMSAYNRINGTFAAENQWLLTEVLRNEWGYDGVVISDWGAVHDPVAAVNAGNDLRMPGAPQDTRVSDALRQGTIDARTLEKTRQRMKLLADRTNGERLQQPDPQAHHNLTRRAAAESAVLLKNDGTLPLKPELAPSVAVVGELARTPRYQGAGSSRVEPWKVVSALEGLGTAFAGTGTRMTFTAGYTLDDDTADEKLVQEAVRAVQQADVCLLFLGLPDRYEAEGKDRTSISLPASQLALLDAVTGSDTPVVVCLSNGSAVTTADWKAGVQAIVEFWLTGQAHGDAIADVLTGRVNPSGKLTETVPARLADTSAHLDYPGEEGLVRYGEGIFVGYRYFDARDIEPDYPFGFGLSYTSFALENLQVSVNDLNDAEAMSVRLTVSNVGESDGSEVIQIYITDHDSRVRTPPRELRAFAKIHLAAGETRELSIPVRRDDLEHYSEAAGTWFYEGGSLTVWAGTSSRDLPLHQKIEVTGLPLPVVLSGWSTYQEWTAHPTVGGELDALIAARGGIKGRLGELLDTATGRTSVMNAPMQTVIEFPGVPFTMDDLNRINTTRVND